MTKASMTKVPVAHASRRKVTAALSVVTAAPLGVVVSVFFWAGLLEFSRGFLDEGRPLEKRKGAAADVVGRRAGAPPALEPTGARGLWRRRRPGARPLGNTCVRGRPRNGPHRRARYLFVGRRRTTPRGTGQPLVVVHPSAGMNPGSLEGTLCRPHPAQRPQRHDARQSSSAPRFGVPEGHVDPARLAGFWSPQGQLPLEHVFAAD
mmetsp:Transcript_8899/g.28919  ORF Transcript_8899/g.28919 Transcript_8899/m.28919 type:complete len:206 (+) Transcript_8899:291-908(+)